MGLELQADYYAGVFANYEKQQGYLESGDIGDATKAAESIGDDHIQVIAYGDYDTASFTHGSSAQRKQWFNKGYSSGNIRDGDTFAALGLEDIPDKLD